MRVERVFGASVIILLSIVFFIKTGTITSGFHFRDDQLYISTYNELHSKGFFLTVNDYIKSDLAQRFRPLFWVHRVIEAKIFGINFLSMSVYTFLLFISTQLMFFIGFKRKGFSFFQILLFLGISFLGEPSVIWWELGPNETLSTFLLALSFYFMTTENKLINHLLFSFFLILSALSKESFAIIIPGFIVLKYCFDNQDIPVSFLSWSKMNKWISIPLITFVGIMFFIVFVIGANSTGYAGVDSNFTSLVFSVISILTTSVKQYILLILILLVLIYFGFRDEKKWLIFLKDLMIPIFFVLLVIVPNLLLYSKTGLWNRYFTPTSIGFGFSIVFLLNALNNKLDWLYKFLVLIISCFVLNLLVDTYLLARNFTQEGARNLEVINIIKENKSVVIVANPLLEYETSISLTMYLETFTDIHYKIYPIEYSDQQSHFGTPELRKQLESDWRKKFKNKLFNINSRLPKTILFLHPSESKKILRSISNSYENIIFNNHYSLYKLRKEYGG